MKKNLPLSRVRTAVYRQPWMITPDGLDAICSIVENHLLSIDDPDHKLKIERLEKEAMVEFLERKKSFQARIVSDGWGGEIDKKFYSVTDGGTGIIRLMGPIFPRANMLTRMSGATALENYSQDFDEMLADDDVDAVIQLVDSPGGAVTLGNEMASKVFAARTNQPKPIYTLVEGTCASLAYLIGSQSDEIYATEASIAGSIGVVLAIEDDTRQSENEGVKRTVLKTGKNKAIGVGPVTDEQIESLKSLMNDYFGRFKSAVSRARPGIDIDSVSDGSLFIGKKAVDAGLVDGIKTLEGLISHIED